MIIPIINCTCRLRCSDCGTARVVASGSVAEEMTDDKLRNIAAQIGWQLEPVVLCPDCVKPDVVP